MFYNILDEPRQILLKKFAADIPLPGSYLAGGTALALMLGHRYSVDFDWFSAETFDPARIAKELGQLGEVKIGETTTGTFHGWVDNIQVTWLWYPNPLLRPLVSYPELPGFKMASIVDIGIMKWAAVSDRGSRKDFIDLFEICHQGITMEYLLPLIARKYPDARINHYHMIKSLTYFYDAECEATPFLLKPISWEQVKNYFKEVQKSLLNMLTSVNI